MENNMYRRDVPFSYCIIVFITKIFVRKAATKCVKTLLKNRL